MKKALVPAAVMAVIEAPFLGTPEVVTEVILIVIGFVSAMVVLVAFWRLTPIASWARWKQRLATWLIAAGAVAAGCFVTFVPVIFKR